MFQFCEANRWRNNNMSSVPVPVPVPVSVYLGGKLSFDDAQLAARYEHVPVGLLVKLQPRTEAVSAAAYNTLNTIAWKVLVLKGQLGGGTFTFIYVTI